MLSHVITRVKSELIVPRLFPPLCSKTERKIGFESFKKALELCAEKKYGSKDDVQKLIDKICAGKGPVAVGATVSLSCYSTTNETPQTTLTRNLKGIFFSFKKAFIDTYN